MVLNPLLVMKIEVEVEVDGDVGIIPAESPSLEEMEFSVKNDFVCNTCHC